MLNLSRKIALSILAASTLVTVAFGALLAWHELHRRDLREGHVREFLTAVYEQKRHDLANELFGEKDLAISETLAEMLRARGMLAAAAYRPDGALAASSGTAPERLPAGDLRAMDQGPVFRRESRKSGPALSLATAIHDMGQKLGYLVLHFDLSETERETQTTVAFFLSLLITLLAVMSLTLNSLLNRAVVRPVARLKEAMGRVSQGRLDEQVDTGALEPISSMAQSFNAMTQALRDAHAARDAAFSRLEQSLAELSRQREELAAANQRLTELDRMKSDFISSVSHELRTPLTSVRGFAKLIRRDFGRAFLPGSAGPEVPAKDSAELARRIDNNLAIIVEESERLTAMVNDVLDLAKIESGRAVWRDRAVDVAWLLQRAADSMAGFFSLSPELRLKVEVPPRLPRLTVDPDRLLQVLQNLLSNAAKFTPRGLVEVLAGPAPGGLRITVRDQGVGVPPDELERIFSMFYQSAPGDILENKVQGAGLGLAICRGIMEHYGGRIWAESAPGAGSSFHLDFPDSALS